MDIVLARRYLTISVLVFTFRRKAVHSEFERIIIIIQRRNQRASLDIGDLGA